MLNWFDESRWTNNHDTLLCSLYEQVEAAVDPLPYTEEFEVLYASFVAQSGCVFSRFFVYSMLVRLRKNGVLSKKFRDKRLETSQA